MDTLTLSLLLAANMSLGIDALQTSSIARNPHFIETNVILGKRPSDIKIAGYFGGIALTETMIALLAPKNVSRTLSGVTIIIEGSAIGHNIETGIRIRF